MHTTALLQESAPGVAAAAPLLSLKGISKSFPGVRALHDVALSLLSLIHI